MAFFASKAKTWHSHAAHSSFVARLFSVFRHFEGCKSVSVLKICFFRTLQFTEENDKFVSFFFSSFFSFFSVQMGKLMIFSFGHFLLRFVLRNHSLELFNGIISMFKFKLYQILKTWFCWTWNFTHFIWKFWFYIKFCIFFLKLNTFYFEIKHILFWMLITFCNLQVGLKLFIRI